jgi:hypothetical protein
MKYLKNYKIFENNYFDDSTKDDIIECFDSFIEDYYIKVEFCKKLHLFDVLNTDVTKEDIKLGFIPYIKVSLDSKQRTSGYHLHNYIQSTNFNEFKKELQSRLSMYNLILKNFHIEVNKLIFLIYKEE